MSRLTEVREGGEVVEGDTAYDALPATAERRRPLRKLRMREVIEVLQERGLEPVGALVDVLPELDPAMRARTLLGLMEYVYPKQARIEHIGEAAKGPNMSITVNFVSP
jgi:uncharacterized protein (UPF0297 family)